jgi:hypothetical protein
VVLLLCSIVLVGAQAFAVEDGDLSNIRALPQAVEIVDSDGGIRGVQDAPIASSQLTAHPGTQDPSGFNIGSVVVAYDPVADTYSFGIDVSCLAIDDTFMPAAGLSATPSVAWDSDGDGRPNLVTDGLLFVSPVITDDDPSPLGGEREEYELTVDIGNDTVNDFSLLLVDTGGVITLTPLGVAPGNVSWGTGQDVEFVVSNVHTAFPRDNDCEYYTVEIHDAFADTRVDSAEEHYQELFELPHPVTLCKVDNDGIPVPNWSFDVTITPEVGAPVTSTKTTGPQGQCAEFLAPANSTVEVCETLPQGSFEAFVEATVTVSGVPQVVVPDPNGPDTFCVTWAANDCPEIELKNAQADFTISKDCVITADPALTIHWEVTVCNTGEVPLDVHVVDPAHIDQWVNDLLPGPANCVTIPASRLVDLDDTERPGTVISNTATGTAFLADTQVEIASSPKSDTSECTVPVPGCQITKTCEITYDPELTIHWAVTVCNTGAGVLDMHVVDTVAGIDQWVYDLPAGECADPIYASRPVDLLDTEPPGTVISNTAYLTGYYADTRTVACESDDTTECTVPRCDWTIAKECLVEGPVGAQTVTWTITVSNLVNSGCTLDIQVVDDDLGVNQLVEDLAPGDSEPIIVGPLSVDDCVTVTNTATGTAFIANSDTQVGLPKDSNEASCDTQCGGGPTRTPGYWFTHPTALNEAFRCLGSPLTLGVGCAGCTVRANDAMAIFWRTSGTNRPTLAQQVLAAMFNQCVLGTPAPAGIIENGMAVLCDPDATSTEIGNVIGPLDDFNNSGDDLPFPAGMNFGNANPKLSRQMAGAGTVPGCAAGTH